MFNTQLSTNQVIAIDPKYGVELYLKRDDLIHPSVSGNKFRKLKYNLAHAKAQHKDTLVTFGGAFSNHIAAVAAAGALQQFKTVGIIRGEELVHKIEENPTLSFAKAAGMTFKFISRADYRNKTQSAFLATVEQAFPNAYILPEGGTNHLAVQGCEEILSAADRQFNVVCCAVGTGGTLAGLINSAAPHQKIIGFPALKGDFLNAEISKFAHQTNWELMLDYHFGGYAKINANLVGFINYFYNEFRMPLDPIYTGKMMYGVFDLIKQNYFKPKTKILAIHTGGLQGVHGMNKTLQRAGLPLITVE